MRGFCTAEKVEEVTTRHIVHEEVDFGFGLEGGSERDEKRAFVFE